MVSQFTKNHVEIRDILHYATTVYCQAFKYSAIIKEKAQLVRVALSQELSFGLETKPNSFKDAALGAILGGFTGEALGGPLEGLNVAPIPTHLIDQLLFRFC